MSALRRRPRRGIRIIEVLDHAPDRHPSEKHLSNIQAVTEILDQLKTHTNLLPPFADAFLREIPAVFTHALEPEDMCVICSIYEALLILGYPLPPNDANFEDFASLTVRYYNAWTNRERQYILQLWVACLRTGIPLPADSDQLILQNLLCYDTLTYGEKSLISLIYLHTERRTIARIYSQGHYRKLEELLSSEESLNQAGCYDVILDASVWKFWVESVYDFAHREEWFVVAKQIFGEDIILSTKHRLEEWDTGFEAHETPEYQA